MRQQQRRSYVDSDVITEQRRSASDVRMTSREIQQLIDAHNARRRSVGATNMQLMVHTCTQLYNTVHGNWRDYMYGHFYPAGAKKETKKQRNRSKTIPRPR